MNLTWLANNLFAVLAVLAIPFYIACLINRDSRQRGLSILDQVLWTIGALFVPIGPILYYLYVDSG